MKERSTNSLEDDGGDEDETKRGNKCENMREKRNYASKGGNQRGRDIQDDESEKTGRWGNRNDRERESIDPRIDEFREEIKEEETFKMMKVRKLEDGETEMIEKGRASIHRSTNLKRKKHERW